jgi:hypothetical protein
MLRERMLLLHLLQQHAGLLRHLCLIISSELFRTFKRVLGQVAEDSLFDAMTLKTIFWTVMAFVMLIGVPVVLVWTLVDHLRGKGRDRKGSGGISAGVGAAMQELDRIMTRPSVEHKVETERPTLKREDDSGGDK